MQIYYLTYICFVQLSYIVQPICIFVKTTQLIYRNGKEANSPNV